MDKKHLSFIPIPALIVIVLALYLAVKPSVFFEPTWLLPITNTVFVTLVCFIVAYIAMRNYKATGQIQILLGLWTFLFWNCGSPCRLGKKCSDGWGKLECNHL